MPFGNPSLGSAAWLTNFQKDSDPGAPTACHDLERYEDRGQLECCPRARGWVHFCFVRFF